MRVCHDEPVSHARLRHDILGSSGVIFYLFAEMPNVDPEIVAVILISGITPCFPQQLGVGHNASSIQCQDPQQFIFNGRQVYRFPILLDAVPVKVHGQGTNRMAVASGASRRCRRATRTRAINSSSANGFVT